MGKNDAAGRLNRPDIPIQTRAEAPKSSCYPARLHPGHAADFRKALAKADDPVNTGDYWIPAFAGKTTSVADLPVAYFNA
jgi:hypothetical protein